MTAIRPVVAPVRLAWLLSCALPVLVAMPLAAAESEAAGPAETEELVLPPIVLEVEDISVVSIEARLPPEQELLAPERSFPLPEAGALEIGEPSLPTSGPLEGEGAGGGSASPIAADVVLGGGTVGRVTARVNLTSTGIPDLRLSFTHESLDGYSGNPAGAGFSSRDDRLDGSLSLVRGPLEARFTGSFADGEIGLQGQASAYSDRALRSLGGGASLAYAPLAWLDLGVEVAADDVAHTLAGVAPARTEAWRIAPRISLGATFGKVSLGLETAYGVRGGDLGTVHRVDVGATFDAELAPAWLVEASVGWHLASGGVSEVPFSLGLSGVIADAFTFTVRGGYRAVPVDLEDLLAAAPLLAPAASTDSTAWFGSLSTSLSAAAGLALNVSATLTRESALVDAGTTAGVVDGLFPLVQRFADRLVLAAGARWNPASWLTLNASASFEIFDRPWFVPWATVGVEASVIDATGAKGARVSFGLEALPGVGFTGPALPVLSLGGFLRVIPAVRLRFDVEDLLAPITGGRTGLGPYVEPGLLVTAMAQIQL